MKIQGRFIAILAVLGLLIALLPLASVGAVAGVVTLSGGEKGQFFSDQTDDNIVTIEVRDADLTPLREGTARHSTGKSAGNIIDLKQYYVAGEKDVTERFHGGTKNGPCLIDTDDKADTPDVMAFSSACSDTDDLGKAEVMLVDSNGVAKSIANNEVEVDGSVYAYRFALEDGVARDRQSNTQDGVGKIDASDIVSVVVNGRSAAASDDNEKAPDAGTGPWFTVTAKGPVGSKAPAGATPGGGATEVTIYRIFPQATDNSVVVTYKDTEFKFDAATPLDFDETRVRYGGSGYGSVTSRIGINGVSGSSITIPNTPIISGYTIVTFGYDVKDTKKDLVTLNSASAGDRKFTAEETDADTDVFAATVALFTQADYTTISTEAKNPDNAAGVSAGTVVNIDELNFTNGLSAVDDTGNRSLWARVQAAAAELGFDDLANDKASDFVDLIIPARDGDVINVTYADTNPSSTVSKSAKVDLAAPVVTLVSPSDGFFTSTSTVTMSARVVDDGAGVNETDIDLKIIDVATSGINLGSQVKTPIANGYRVTMVPEGAITEGLKEWFVGVKDKVGNIPVIDNALTTGVNEAPKGAGSKDAGSAENPYEFTIDTRAPRLSSGETGVSLKNAGVTSGEDKESQKTNDRNWVRVVFDTGDGEAPLDPSTVDANDFRVDDLAPLDAKINSVSHDDGETTKGTAVYLQVGQLDTDARPEVELTGEIRDKAGNIRTAGRIPAVNDGLAPKIEVTPSTDLAKDSVTVTISASENLRSNPVVNFTKTKPVNGEDLENTTTETVSLQTGSLTTWTVTFDNTPGQASRQYVVVSATDLAEKSDTVGDASTENDIVSFQVDDADPKLAFEDAAGDALKDSKQEEGAVWLVAEFDEDEHEDDKSRGVTVTAMTLKDTESGKVVEDDVSMVFGSEVDCVDPDDADRENKCAQRTLAVNLTPGMYNIAVTGVDATGNEVSGDVDFEVTEAKPFELTLRPGQNFISIPGMPMGDGGMLDTLFSDPAITAVSTYDRSLELQGANPWLRASKDLETGMFSGDITMIEPGKAYFVSSSASVTVEVKLQPPGELPPTIPVRQGYNAIGFWSISGADDAEIDLYLNSIGWSLAYSYDPTPGKGWEVIRKGELDSDDNPRNIEAGKGYLVYATYDAVLTP